MRFTSEVRRGALLVLQRAVQELQDRHNVVVVDADNKVSVRSVARAGRVLMARVFSLVCVVMMAAVRR